MAITKEALKGRAIKLGELRSHRVYANSRNAQNGQNVQEVKSEEPKPTRKKAKGQ